MSESSDTLKGVKLALEYASCFIDFCEKCDTDIHEIFRVLKLCGIIINSISDFRP